MGTKVNAIDCKFPMRAVGKCEVHGVEYQPEDEFDAITSDSYDFLVQQGAAIDISSSAPSNSREPWLAAAPVKEERPVPESQQEGTSDVGSNPELHEPSAN